MSTTPVNLVMVVDDNDTDLLIARIVIEKSGFGGKIIVKNSGKAALEYVQAAAKGIEEMPQIIFLDINMPVVSGLTFLQEFEKIDPQQRAHTKVAMLTSSDNKTDMERFTDIQSVFDFVSKPISIESFQKVTQKYSNNQY